VPHPEEICDTILWLQAGPSGTRFPTVQFSADTDMATAGWVALTSLSRHEIVVTQMTAEEFRSTTGFVDLENRVNALLGRDDLRFPALVGSEGQAPAVAGQSFQQFRRDYRPPRLFYRDIFSSDALAEEVARMSRNEFEEGGGTLTIL
jgi:hypothetical protein